MKKNKKTKRSKKLPVVLGIIIGVIAAFFIVTSVIAFAGNRANLKKISSFPQIEFESRTLPSEDAEGNYSFVTDAELKIVQLTDIHIGGGWMSLKKDALALNAVAAMLTAEKPDLCIVTGDIAYPVPFQSGTINNKVSARLFAELMEQLGVYWTVAFGNHDTEIYSLFSRDEIADFYMSYPHCIFTKGPAETDGCGNQIITVKKTDGTYSQVLYVFDSNTYLDSDKLGIKWMYDNIHDNQISWYSESVEHFNELNAELTGDEKSEVKSLAFFHIPTEEYKTAWTEYVFNGFKDTADTKLVYGTAGCTGRVIYCTVKENNLFETMLSLGSTQGLFCGHDHSNNFSLDYKGIRLTYGMSVDYLAIPGIAKRGAQRGCTVISVMADGSFDCHSENYYQSKYKSVFDKEEVTMQTVEPLTVFE